MNLLKPILAGAVALGLALPVAAQDRTGTLAKIDASGEIVIGHRESSVPFAYLDENQKPVGYSIDLCMKIVEAVSAELGKELSIKYVPVNPKTRIALMANGTIDLECGSTTNNLTRQEQVEYLPTTFITGTKLMVRKGSGISSVADLDGKAVALAQGTTNERAVKAAIETMGLDVKVLPVRDHAEGMLSLETDRVDVYATDHILLFGLIAKSKTPDAFEVVGDFLSFDPYALMVRRDDSAFELVGKKALAAVFRSGEIDAIYAKWFDPLGVGQTDLLKAAFQLNALPE
ncbi:amino acid ABC transporter substrate-binding protein [Ruegeria pomeroyi]|jgi:glutamate/aspartate transport system substrate-binding protein|uniref:Glutamate/aspartate ABC transporter, periplasmic substrate-binding protein n=2 Tax=Ruegeria pomeroyi TaxID=89184 RepID=Q5LQ38_RUEPO|nr:amino acid ABC transporter substrate-binding protein [Ruegeria pomeroyi]AAV95903.1 cysteate ABC transporter, periplasmic substrate-binding protein [Ruegeria pomeroyi DSS-3]NVK98230.1 amino acid ABC transporter substrate-binding protein [Ruegeria pomeroyi]NVL03207.1 amino acid ABC transporter substrate-binding protein [Ruegeria pomeroyi]QWV09471.1 amino acid ABC transporter substrate-binding protein [Ruegeria pomeroyi]